MKNFLVLAPPFFGGVLFTSTEMFLKMLLAFIAFSLASSTAYITNDISDIESDRMHPKKKLRAVAAGRIGVPGAILVAVITLILSIGASLAIGKIFTLITVIYLALNFLYSYYLEKIVIIDVFTIGIGFVLRIEAGGVASGIEVSNWLLLTTFLLSLLLAFGKRRYELVMFRKNPNPFREVLSKYRENFLDTTLGIFATAAIVTYSIYTVELDSKVFLATVPFACYGVLRYMYLVQTDTSGDPTESFLKDLPLFLCVLLWFLITAAIIYLGNFTGFTE
ncbi:MAG: decaprenyl-phosphate phosphoribosyltransferase [Deltaproteobacteria bacterium]